jgi:hypothetical protein
MDARLGTWLLARLYHGSHLRLQDSMRLQGATLTDPYVNLSAHTALTVQPPPDAATANEQRAAGHAARWHGSAAPSVGDAAASANGFALSKRLLPLPVDLPIRPDGVTPSLQPHYRTFLTTTGDSAPVPRFGTRALVGLPLELLPSHRGDRFPRSTQEPEPRSRRLHAGRRLGSKQVPPRLIPG